MGLNTIEIGRILAIGTVSVGAMAMGSEHSGLGIPLTDSDTHTFTVHEPIDCRLIPENGLVFSLSPRPIELHPDLIAQRSSVGTVKSFATNHPEFPCKINPDGSFRIDIPETTFEGLRTLKEISASGGELVGVQGNTEKGYITGQLKSK